VLKIVDKYNTKSEKETNEIQVWFVKKEGN
jgi:hypothetical protein